MECFYKFNSFEVCNYTKIYVFLISSITKLYEMNLENTIKYKISSIISKELLVY